MGIKANAAGRRSQRCYFVYLLASLSGTLYVGLTDNLWKRMGEHRAGLFDGFTRKYKVNRLMYYETFRDSAIAANRERQIKKGEGRKRSHYLRRVTLNGQI